MIQPVATKLLRNFSLHLILSLVISSSSTSAAAQNIADAEILHQLNQSLNQAIIYDGFSPPVAARIYAYSNLGSYEALRIGHKEIPSLIPHLNDFKRINDESYEFNIDNRVVMIELFGLLAKQMVYHR